MTFPNGTTSTEIGVDGWRKAQLSQGNSNCAELRPTGDGQVAIRNSRHPEGPALIFTKGELGALLDGVRRGEFDDLAH